MMTSSEEAFRMEIQVRKLDSNRGEMILIAQFGRSRLGAHRLETMGFKAFPYNIDYGFTGGDLTCRLSSCRAPIKGRLVSGYLATAVSEKIIRSAEAAGSTTTTNKGQAGVSAKDGLTVGGESSDQNTKSDKLGEVREITRIRALIHTSGPDDCPSWRFEGEVKGECLSGRAPGDDNPPLAVIQFDQFPSDIEAVFAVLPSDVEVIVVNPGKFDGQWVPKIAVARRALRKGLANMYRTQSGTVIVKTDSLAWASQLT
jgi:hypothetical protein